MRTRKAGAPDGGLYEQERDFSGQRRGPGTLVLVVALILLVGLGAVVLTNEQVVGVVSVLWRSATGRAGAPAAVAKPAAAAGGAGATATKAQPAVQQSAASAKQAVAAKEAKPAATQAKAAKAASFALNQPGAPVLSTGDGHVIVRVPVDAKKSSFIDIIDEPIPEDCSAEQHADYDGDAVMWGLGHKVKSAADCCRRCKEFNTKKHAQPCNIWVWCGDPSGKCWTMDIHSHTTGDCWLKFQAKWDNKTDRATTNLAINHRGRFSPEFKKEHKTAPEWVPWIAGIMQPK